MHIILYEKTNYSNPQFSKMHISLHDPNSLFNMYRKFPSESDDFEIQERMNGLHECSTVDTYRICQNINS